MALDGTYSGLLASIASYLARDDLSAVIPDFVTVFEAAANRRLRVRQQEQTATLTPSSGVAALPADYLAYRTVFGSAGQELEYAHPVWLRSAYPNGEGGVGKYFTIEGGNLTVGPSSDEDVTFNYYEKIDALSGTVNWLYTAHPDVYLFGSLAEAHGFTDNPEKLVGWKSRRDEIFDEIVRLSNKSRVGAVRPFGSIV